MWASRTVAWLGILGRGRVTEFLWFVVGFPGAQALTDGSGGPWPFGAPGAPRGPGQDDDRIIVVARLGKS